MDITKILAYQDVDKDLIRLENEVKNSKEAEKRNLYKNEFKKATDEILRLSMEMEDSFAAFRRLSDQYGSLGKEIKELGESVNEENDEKQLDYYASKLERYSALLAQIESDLIKISDQLKTIQAQAQREYENAQQSKKLFNLFAQKAEDLRQEKGADAKKLMLRLKELEKDIPAELMERYRRVRANKKTPVFVPFIAPRSCGGCGMELANDVVGKLKDTDVQECPNCGRLVYRKDK